jgi:hypothetical protein
VHSLRPDIALTAPVTIASRFKLANDSALEPGFFPHLAQSRLRDRLAGLSFAFGKGPIVVLRAMYQNHTDTLTVSFQHDSAGGYYFVGFRGKRHLTEGSTEEAKR